MIDVAQNWHSGSGRLFYTRPAGACCFGNSSMSPACLVANANTSELSKRPCTSRRVPTNLDNLPVAFFELDTAHGAIERYNFMDKSNLDTEHQNTCRRTSFRDTACTHPKFKLPGGLYKHYDTAVACRNTLHRTSLQVSWTRYFLRSCFSGQYFSARKIGSEICGTHLSAQSLDELESRLRWSSALPPLAFFHKELLAL
jgi:hypothetical protein